MADAHMYRQKLALLIVDILAFLTAFVGVMEFRFGYFGAKLAELGWVKLSDPPWTPMLSALPVILGVWLITLLSCAAYRIERNRMFIEFGRVVKALLVMAGILLSVTFFYRGFSYSRGFTALFLPLLLMSTFFGRVLFRIVRRRIEGIDSAWHRVLLVGNNSIAKHLAESSPENPVQLTVVGVLDDEEEIGTTVHGDIPVMGRTNDLEQIAKANDVHGVIITESKMEEAKQLELLDICISANLEWQVVPSAYDLIVDRYQLDVVAGVPVLGMRRCNIRGFNRFLKRAFDIIVATTALLLLSPLMGLIALLIKLCSRGPVLFAQDRIGESGKPFRFYKFRSMHVGNDDAIHREYTRKLIEEGAAADVDQEGELYKIKEDPRLIPFIGVFIRSYSIDELPQLFNVLKGDMSLIGPRPPIPYEVDVYHGWHKRRFEGPPGITGLWQVSGRSRLSFEEMVKLDIEYLENWSFGRDLKILWRTMGVVLFDRAC